MEFKIPIWQHISEYYVKLTTICDLCSMPSFKCARLKSKPSLSIMEKISLAVHTACDSGITTPLKSLVRNARVSDVVYFL